MLLCLFCVFVVLGIECRPFALSYSPKTLPFYFYFEIGSTKLPSLGWNSWPFCLSVSEYWDYRHDHPNLFFCTLPVMVNLLELLMMINNWLWHACRRFAITVWPDCEPPERQNGIFYLLYHQQCLSCRKHLICPGGGNVWLEWTDLDFLGPLPLADCYGLYLNTPPKASCRHRWSFLEVGGSRGYDARIQGVMLGFRVCDY